MNTVKIGICGLGTVGTGTYKLIQQNAALVGQTVEVLVDGRHPDPDAGAERAFVGRTVRDAPEVDGAVYLAESELSSGDLVLARIEGVEDYDLRARVVGPLT